MKYDVRETAAGKSVSAYVVLKGSRQVATVRSHYSDGGRVIVNVWQRGEAAERSAKAAAKAGEPLKAADKYESPGEYQAAAAGGGGYDKFAAALAGMWIDGHVMGNHSSPRGAPRKPRGLPYYPTDSKAPRGYHFANHGAYEVSTGKRVDNYEWRDRARAELGEAAEWDAVERRGREMQRQAAESGATVSGYSDCYRSVGLRFLEETGYTVIQAL